MLPAASVGKVLLLIEVARTLDLAEPLTRTREDAVADSGLWQHLAVDTLPAGDLAALVGAVSDNLATNVLLRRVGLDAVRRTAGELGLEHTALHDRVRDARTAAHPPALSTATASELSLLFTRLDERVLGWLALDADLSMVAGGLGLDPLAHVEPERGIRRGAASERLGDAGRPDLLEAEPAVDARDVGVLGLDEHELRAALARVLHEPRGHERGEPAAAGARQRGDADDRGHLADGLVASRRRARRPRPPPPRAA